MKISFHLKDIYMDHMSKFLFCCNWYLRMLLQFKIVMNSFKILYLNLEDIRYNLQRRQKLQHYKHFCFLIYLIYLLIHWLMDSTFIHSFHSMKSFLVNKNWLVGLLTLRKTNINKQDKFFPVDSAQNFVGCSVLDLYSCCCLTSRRVKFVHDLRRFFPWWLY